MSKLKTNVRQIEAKVEKIDIMHYTDRNTDLIYLVSQIEKWFKDIKFPTQIVEGDNKWLIQARKNNYIRALVAGARSINIIIEGTSNDYTVQISTGKWINNIVIAGVITFLTCGAAAAPLGACAAWTLKIKRDLKKFIEIAIDFEKHN
jgi:hypothetical protein